MQMAFDELTAADVMGDNVVAIPEVMSLRGAARVLAEAGACAAPVVDTRGRCVGLLRAADVLRWVADGERRDPNLTCFWSEWQMVPSGESEVGRRMIADPPVVPPDVPLLEVVRELVARRTTAVVVDGRHRPLGTLSPADVLAAVTADRGRPGRRSAARPARSAWR